MDELDLMIDRAKAKLDAETPIFVTLAETFYEFADEMSSETFQALEEVGERAIEAEGQLVNPATMEPAPVSLAGFFAVTIEQLQAEGVETDELGRPKV